MSRICVRFLVGLCLCAPLVADAQDLRRDTLLLDEVIVTASKFGESKKTISYQVEQIKASEITFRNAQTTADLLQSSGQVFVQKSQAGGGSPVLRGFEANRILLVVDGVRMNNAIFRGGHLQNILRVDQNLLEQVEVVYGPASVVYGSDALGGVIHLKTKMPELSESQKALFKTSILTRVASASNELTTNATVSIGGPKFGSLTGFSTSSFGDVRQGARRRSEYPDFGKRETYIIRENDRDVEKLNSDPNVQVGTAYKQYDLLQKFIYSPSERTRHVLNVQLSNSTDVPRYDRLTQIRNGKLRFGDWYYGPEKRFMASYHLRLEGQRYYDELLVTAAFQDIQESRNTRSLGSKTLKSQVERVNAHSLNLDAEKLLGTHTLRYGLEYVHNDVASRATFTSLFTGSTTPADTRYPDGGSTMDWMAGYVTNQWHLADAWYLNGGVRLTRVNLQSNFSSKEFFPFSFNKAEQNTTALTGNLGLTWTSGQRTKFSLLASSGFRAPNVDDIGKVFDSQPGLVVVPNPSLRSEYAYNLEATLEKRFGRTIRLNATLFNSWLRDALVIAPFSFNGQSTIVYDGVTSLVTANQNVQQAVVRGMSVEMNVYPSSGWRVQGIYNLTQGRIIEANGSRSPLDHIPPAYGKFSVQWQRKAWRIEFFSLYNGWKRIEDYRLNSEDNEAGATPDGMPAWNTLNLRTSYAFTPFLTLQASVENIMDINYRTFASGVSAPGRNFIMALRGNF